VPHNTFGLQGDVSHACLDSAWRALVRQQAQTLAAMLHRIQTTVAGSHTDVRQLQVVAEDAERFLTAQAQQHISLERE